MENQEIRANVESDLKEKILKFYFFNRSKVNSWVAFFLGAMILIVSYFTYEVEDKELIHTKEIFQRWKNLPSDESLAKDLRQKLKKIPAFARSLEAEIIQTMLSVGQVEVVHSSAEICIARLREEAPFHAIFAETSLLIEDGKFQSALELSVALKEQMEGSQKELESVLYACNILRIAFLQKKLGNQHGELAAWNEVKSLINNGESISVKLLEANFEKKNFSLSNYIEQRKRIIHRS